MSDFYSRDRSDGVSQTERFPEALRPGYFAIDELSVDQLLVLGKRLAENLKYFNLRNEGDGTWVDLFTKDPAFLLTDIANTDSARIEAQYRASVAKQSISAQPELAEGLKSIKGLKGRIDSWSGALRASSQPQITATNAEISQILTTLTDKLDEIEKILTDEGGRTRDHLTDLDEKFQHFLGAITYLKSLAGRSLDADAAARDQNPAVSLFIAFLKLYSRAQHAINNFPAKRLDFYYSQLLQATLRSRQPDSVDLALTLAPGQPAVVVPKGTQFLAGKDAADNDVVFASDEELTLTDTTVRLIRTFCLESDPLISPQNELGCVTRISANEMDAASAAGLPLFGAGASSTAGRSEIGLAIASPLLHLREGERKIVFEIECKPNADIPKKAKDAATWVADTDSAHEFRRRLGQMLVWELMSDDRDDDRVDYRALFDTKFVADQATPDVIPDLLKELTENRSGLFYRLLRDSFEVRLTTEEGWSLRKNYVIAPLPKRSDGCGAGLCVELSLSADDPAIVAYDRTVHGGDFSTDQPVASLRMNANSTFYAYSLFATMDIRAVNLDVDVRGARALVAYGDLGQLDSSKPFFPFGPQPSRDSYIAIGNYEAARKPLSHARVNIDWGGLSRDAGGFENYYRGYTTDFSSDSFKAQTSVLTHSGWASGESESQPLFSTVPESGQIGTDCSLDLLRGQRFVALESNVAEIDYRLDSLSHSGFFRIDLGPSENAFGHAEYPLLLNRILTANARRRKPLPLPQPPYTPLINRISLDYRAQAIVRFRTDSASHVALTENKLFHEHPFGFRELVQFGGEKSVPLMPRFARDGYLLLGLSSSGPPGTISLLFDLSGGERRSTDQTLSCEWKYLSGNVFKPLPQEAILRDTTANFTFSGTITIELPDDIDTANTILEGDYYWIAIGACGDLHLCPRLHAIRTGALRAVRQIIDENTKFAPLARGSISEAISAPAGIGEIVQLGDSFGGRPAEERDHLITRTAERLHHKDRACQPWDYERLVLERFPDLYKVKCFANMTTKSNRPMPGEVLIVVVPRLIKAGMGQAQRLLVNPGRLEQIREYLSGKTSRFANVAVRNPVYELVQIRCSVKLVRPLRHGEHVRDLDQVISDFISPWRPGGYGADFGWRIRRKDIETYIGALRYVEFVTDFSMLHITQDSKQDYCLVDTKGPKHSHPEGRVSIDELQANGEGADDEVADEIVPRYPWSLMLPTRRHFIRTMSELHERTAEPTGVGELEVGSTLILDAGNRVG